MSPRLSAAVDSATQNHSNTDKNISQAKPIILVLGDSLSSAHGIEPKEGWVALLEKRLQERKYPYQVVNSSISGDTTSNGKARLKELLSEYHPAILILGLGSNDGLRGLSTVAMKQNITAMVKEAKENQTKVILVGFLIPLNYGEEYRKRFEQVFREVALEEKLPEVPFLLEKVALDPALMQSDGLHPNQKGQPLILENVWVYLQPLLIKKSREI